MNPDWLIQAFPLLLAEVRMWYALPMIVGVSLAYAATRHEEPQRILHHALRFGGGVVLILVVVALLMQLLS